MSRYDDAKGDVRRARRAAPRRLAGATLERLVQRTESFLREVPHWRELDASAGLTGFLRDLEQLGCRDVNVAGALIEAVSRGDGAALIGPPRAPISSTVTRTLDFLRQHYMDRITWRYVAASLRRNPSYLARRFRHETGTTLRAHLGELRMRQAAEELASGEKVEVAMLSVGYHSKRAFYSHFRMTFGVTPGAYRRFCGNPPVN
jgi:AraC-like DNA-binding protein